MDRIAKRPERALTDPLAEPVGVAGLREIVPAVVVRENAAPEALADALASLSSHLLLQILLRAKDSRGHGLGRARVLDSLVDGIGTAAEAPEGEAGLVGGAEIRLGGCAARVEAHAAHGHLADFFAVFEAIVGREGRVRARSGDEVEGGLGGEGLAGSNGGSNGGSFGGSFGGSSGGSSGETHRWRRRIGLGGGPGNDDIGYERLGELGDSVALRLIPNGLASPIPMALQGILAGSAHADAAEVRVAELLAAGTRVGIAVDQVGLARRLQFGFSFRGVVHCGKGLNES